MLGNFRKNKLRKENNLISLKDENGADKNI